MHFDIKLQVFEEGHNVTLHWSLTPVGLRQTFFFFFSPSPLKTHVLAKTRVLNLAKNTINNQA